MAITRGKKSDLGNPDSGRSFGTVDSGLLHPGNFPFPPKIKNPDRSPGY